ncbi:MAG: hypothetical protein FWE69_01945 [Clostridiales bacterium]|nr:hypothetical protein [Clostridiales bacterium]
MIQRERAWEILKKHVGQPHLIMHAVAVSAAMGAMAGYFGDNPEHWESIGILHDVDYEKYPEAHLAHARAMLEAEGIDEADIRAVLSHGYGFCNEIKPETPIEKSLFTVDELTGIVLATAFMRPTGFEGLELSSVKKKFKDKRFAAGCNRDVILRGCEMLGLEPDVVMSLTLAGMKTQADALKKA